MSETTDEPTTITLQQLQDGLPWGAHDYTDEFRAYDVPHRDFAHAFVHLTKALGQLAQIVDEGDHRRLEVFPQERVDKYLADLIIVTLRMANVCPGRKVDLSTAVQARILEKFPPGR